MTWPLLQFLTAVYIGGLVVLYRKGWRLPFYVWSAFGFTFLFIHLSLLQGWNETVAEIEAQHVQTLMAPLGISLQVIERSVLLVPESTGWSGLQVGVECSTLIEWSVLAGLLLFYPSLPLRKRWLYLAVGSLGTYLLNLARMVIIVVMIAAWGKPAVPVAHAVVARLVYFAGIVVLYWSLLTAPTLAIVRRWIETSGRGAI